MTSKGEHLVVIDPQTAAGIVRSNIIPKFLRGWGSSAQTGVEAGAEIAKTDVVEMVRNDTVPEGVKIVGGSKL